MTPRKKNRRRDPQTASDAVLIRFVSEALPGDTDVPGRERKGRPDYSYLTEPGAAGPGTDSGPPALYHFTAKLLTPEEDPHKGVRIGRPERSPSLPPPDNDRPGGNDAKPPVG